MTKKKITVAVSGLNAIDSPVPGISVIRSLRESKEYDVRIIGLSYETLEPGIYMENIADKTYQVPYPSAGQESLLERIKYIHEVETLDVIIPNFDAELFSYIKLAQTLKSMGIRTFLPTMQQFEERQKSVLYGFGLRNGVNVPFSKSINSVHEIHNIVHEFTYPVMVKGKFYEAYTAYNAEQALNYFNKLNSKWGLPIVVQQFVKGFECNVTAIGDGEGNMIGAVAMRKQFITDKGKAWAGITIEDDDLMQLAKKLFQSTQWRGGLELEMIKDEKGTIYLIEINPRFPAWIYLATGVGQNHPEALIKMAMGEKVEPFADYEVGKMFIRYSWDMIVDLKDFEKISTLGEY